MDIQTIQTIGPVVVLVLILIFLAARTMMNKEGKADVKKFLDTLADKFEGIIVDHLDEIDFKDFHNLAEIEGTILSEIYDQIWALTIAALENSTESAFTKLLIKKFLTRETVEAFIKYIFTTDKVQVAYTSKYNKALLSSNNIAITFADIENLENEIAEENSKYESEDVELTDRDNNWVSEKLANYPDGDMNTELIPPSDEVSISENDSSVEEVQ